MAVDETNGLSVGVTGRVLEVSLFSFVSKNVLEDSDELLIGFASRFNDEVELEAGDDNDFFR